MENITRNALVRYLQQAQELLDLYGYARKYNEQGLMPYVAVGLTALPSEAMHITASAVATKGSAGGSAAFPAAQKVYIPQYEAHLCAVRAALEEHVGQGYVLVHSPQGIRHAMNELR